MQVPTINTFNGITWRLSHNLESCNTACTAMTSSETPMICKTDVTEPIPIAIYSNWPNTVSVPDDLKPISLGRIRSTGVTAVGSPFYSYSVNQYTRSKIATRIRCDTLAASGFNRICPCIAKQ